MAASKEIIFGVFDDLVRRDVDPKLSTSFRKYSIAMDELIADMITATGLPEEEFRNRLSRKQIDELNPRGGWQDQLRRMV